MRHVAWCRRGACLGFTLWVVAASGSDLRLSVTTTADSGAGSLRAAIETLNATGDGDIDLQAVSGGVVALESSLPEIRRNARLLGPATAVLSVSGQGRWPILSFAEGTTSVVSRLVLANALATGYRHGAAIANAGVLTLKDCWLVANRNQYGWGGGIYSRGDLTLLDCTFRTNVVVGEAGGNATWMFVVSNGVSSGVGAGGGGAGFGGAVFQDAGRLYASNCVFVGNQAVGGAGGSWIGDGVGSGRGGGVTGGDPGTSDVAGKNGGFGSGGGGGGGAPDYIGGGLSGAGGFGGGTAADLRVSGSEAGAGAGGAAFLRAGIATFVKCGFEANLALGGTGGDGSFSGGNGGDGWGGGYFVHAASVTLERCSLVGNVSSGGGGGLSTDPSFGTSPGRGGIAEGGAGCSHGGGVTLESCLVSSNQTAGGQGGSGKNGGTGGSGRGGAVVVRGGEARLAQSLFLANAVSGASPGGGRRGVGGAGDAHGGALGLLGGKVWIENCTLSRNRVRGADGYTGFGFPAGHVGGSYGGGVAVWAQDNAAIPEVRLRYSSIVENEAAQAQLVVNLPSIPTGNEGGEVGGGGIFNAGGTLQLEGILCALNRAATSADLGGAFDSLQPNLVQHPGSATGFKAHDLTGVDPKLDALQDNGGPTPTYGLLTGSPAQDVIAVAGTDAPASDQRGASRPYGARADLGAFEWHFGDAPAPRIVEFKLDEDRRFGLRVSGVIGQACEVEYSSDLIAWIALGEATEGAFFWDPAQRSGGYYRLRRTPPNF